jgi:hypothetical protein
MTPRQPFSDYESVVTEAGANFGGPRWACVREMRVDFMLEGRLSLREALLL